MFNIYMVACFVLAFIAIRALIYDSNEQVVYCLIGGVILFLIGINAFPEIFSVM